MIAAKLALGVVLSLAFSALLAVLEVLTRRWPHTH